METRNIMSAALSFTLSIVVLALLIDKGAEYGFLWIMSGFTILGTGAILITTYIDWRLEMK